MAKKKSEDETQEQGAEQQAGETKTRKPREVKVKHAKGSPHEILHTMVDSLSSTEADYLHRHVIKKGLKDEHTAPDSYEGELYTRLRTKALPAA